MAIDCEIDIYLNGNRKGSFNTFDVQTSNVSLDRAWALLRWKKDSTLLGFVMNTMMSLIRPNTTLLIWMKAISAPSYINWRRSSFSVVWPITFISDNQIGQRVTYCFIFFVYFFVVMLFCFGYGAFVLRYVKLYSHICFKFLKNILGTNHSQDCYIPIFW